MYDVDDGLDSHIVTIVISDTVFDSSSPSLKLCGYDTVVKVRAKVYENPSQDNDRR